MAYNQSMYTLYTLSYRLSMTKIMMQDYPSAFSLGASFALMHEKIAADWQGATDENSTHYDELCQCLNPFFTQSSIDESKIINVEVSSLHFFVFLAASSFFYQITTHTFLQIIAFPNDSQSITEILQYIKHTPADQKYEYHLTLEAGHYYLFDVACEFQDMLQDENYLCLSFNEKQNLVVQCQHYDNAYFTGNLYDFNPETCSV